MSFLISLEKYILAISPFLLLGLTIAGFVHIFLDVDKVKKLINTGKIRDIFMSAFLGVPLPLCSCAVIPSAVTLRKSGVRNGATSSFLISTPETGVDSIMVTYAMMDFPMTIVRPLAAFISASFAGILQHFFNDFEYKKEVEVKSCCKKSSTSIPSDSISGKFKEAIRFAYVDLLDDIAHWLFVGILTGALIDYYVPVDLFLSLDGTLAKLLILLVGIPMYVCASATTPIAAALVAKGLTPGAALIFLLVGPATNISNILVLQKYIGKKGVVLNIVSIAVVSLILSFVVDFIYTYFSLPVIFKVSHQHSHGASIFDYLLSAAFVLLLIVSLIKTNYNKYLKRS